MIKKHVAVIDTAEAMKELADFLDRSSPPVMGFAVAYDFEGPPIKFNVAESVCVSDLSNLRPRYLALTAAGDGRRECNGRKFLVDLQNDDMRPGLDRIFSLPAVFAGFDLKMALFNLWKLGVEEPGQVWDCFMYEKARSLGRYNPRYFTTGKGDWLEDINARNKALESMAFNLSLEMVCQVYGVDLLCFIKDDPAVCDEDDAVALAAAAEVLYNRQTSADSLDKELVDYCRSVEMPWVVTNASMEWIGVRVDYGKAEAIIRKIEPALDELSSLLAGYGIDNPRSSNDIERFFRRVGLLDRFGRGGYFSFDKEKLEAKRRLHPAIPIILRTRKLLDIVSNRILAPEISGSDGRVHPIHGQLGADTGRQTCRHPNVAGLNRFLKPVIIPAEGYGIGEADYSQIEPGIAGAVYGDSWLVDMYNTEDIYVAMAKSFFHNKLTDSDKAMGHADFKARFPELREQVKTCTLGIIYGMTPYGIANELDISRAEAEALQDDFMKMFPKLTAALDRQKASCTRGRYVSIMGGLKRYKGDKRISSHLRTWEKTGLSTPPSRAAWLSCSRRPATVYTGCTNPMEPGW